MAGRPDGKTSGALRRRSRLLMAAAAAGLAVGAVGTAAQATSASAATTPTTIGVGYQPADVAMDPATDMVYTANEDLTNNSGAGTVSVIDGATNTVTATIAVGIHPVAVAVDPVTDTIYVANSDAPVNGTSTVSVINGATNTVTATVNVGTNPLGIAVNPATDRIYVVNYTEDTMSVINGATNTVTATISLPANAAPSTVAVNPSTDIVYVGNQSDNSVSVINGASNTITATITGITPSPRGIAVDPVTGTVYVSGGGIGGNQPGTSVIDGATNAVTATIAAGTGPLAVDPSTRTLYLINTSANDMSVVDESTNAVLTTLPVGYVPTGIAADAATSAAYVSDWGFNKYTQPGSVLVLSLDPQGIPTPIGALGFIALTVAAAVGLVVIQRRSQRSKSFLSERAVVLRPAHPRGQPSPASGNWCTTNSAAESSWRGPSAWRSTSS